MTTQHAKSNAREGDGVADHVAVLRELGTLLTEDYEAAVSGKYHAALTAAIAAMQAQQGAEPVGFVLVPREATDAMLHELMSGAHAFDYREGSDERREEIMSFVRSRYRNLLALAATGAPR